MIHRSPVLTPSSATSVDSLPRKRPASPLAVNDEKRARLNGSTTINNDHLFEDDEEDKERLSVPMASSRRESNASSVSTVAKTMSFREWQKAQDLEKQFSVIKDEKQAIRYHQMFEVSRKKLRMHAFKEIALSIYCKFFEWNVFIRTNTIF